MWLIIWVRDGIARRTICTSGSTIALKYALMRERQGYTVDIEEV